MKADLKETIRNEYVHGHINDLGQRVMPTLEDLITKHEAPASTVYRISSKKEAPLLINAIDLFIWSGIIQFDI